jgi:hypothetical protein
MLQGWAVMTQRNRAPYGMSLLPLYGLCLARNL